MPGGPADVATGLLAGRIAAGARAIRWLDDRDPRGIEVLRAIFPHSGRAHIVGITGPPGAGKSTLTDMMVAEERRRGRRVGVVAVDPSSPFTGGAILGDRVRMARHTLDEGVFIRSIGTRGQAGGLSRSTHDACLVLDAMGYEVIFVETVGVGQDEIDIVNLAHTTIIVGVPGLGDEVQAVKAGLMEAGEIFVINKADREGYEAAHRQFALMLHLREQAGMGGDWHPPLLRSVASRDEGAAAIVDVIDAHLAHLKATGTLRTQTGRREREQLRVLLRDMIEEDVLAAGGELLTAVEERRLDPYSAATALFARWRRQDGERP